MPDTDNLTYYLARELTCAADLQASGIMHIEGAFSGAIRGTGVLIAGRHATIECVVEVDTVVVAGSFKGDIVARRKVAILHCATVCGTVCSPVCDIEHGATVNARLDITKLSHTP